MKIISKLLLLSFLVASLSGCLAAAVGAGAAGGAYIEKNYDVDFKVKKKKPAEKRAQAQTSQAD